MTLGSLGCSLSLGILENSYDFFEDFSLLKCFFSLQKILSVCKKFVWYAGDES